jgi:hypothetical protein
MWAIVSAFHTYKLDLNPRFITPVMIQKPNGVPVGIEPASLLLTLSLSSQFQ